MVKLLVDENIWWSFTKYQLDSFFVRKLTYSFVNFEEIKNSKKYLWNILTEKE